MIKGSIIGSIIAVGLINVLLVSACGISSNSCGNGFVDNGETCDIGIPTGQKGACPTSCTAPITSCTTSILQNAGTCTAACVNTPITACVSGDGCCPTAGTCNNNTDSDCPVVCGNGAVEAGEACDIGIPAGQTGACPTSCTPPNSCTTSVLQDAGTCTAACVNTPISGLVAFYPFNGNANDASGNGNNGTVHGATLTADQAGTANSAYSFNGTSNYIEVPNNPILQPASALTVTAWVFPVGFYGGTCGGNYIVSKQKNDDESGAYRLEYSDYPNNCYVFDTNNETFGFGVTSSSGTRFNVHSNPIVQTNNWYFVVGVYTGNSVVLYVNGILEKEVAVTEAFGSNTEPLFIGKNNDPSYPYYVNGDITDVRIYNRALSASEIAVLYSCELNTSANAGRIIAANDDWILSDTGFVAPNDPGVFALNIANWFTGGVPGKFLAYSDHLGLTGSNLADVMTSAGHTWTVDTSVSFDLATLSKYNGVFLGVTPADNSVLIEYVNAGGNVYVFSGGDTEPGKWNVFLQHFGLQFESINNGLVGNIPITSTHPLFSGVHYLYHDIGTSVDDLNPADPKNEVIDVYQEQGLFAVYDPKAVTSSNLESIAITPANPSVTVGYTKQFVATGTYLDSTIKDITNEVTWDSSNKSIATISAAGMATLVAAGQTTISATSGSISDSTTLTVNSANAGRIIAANDDWILSDTGFVAPNDPGVFALNIANWFTGGVPGKFLAYSDHFGLTGSNLADVMTSAGHTWTVDTSGSFDLATLSKYDGVFLGVTPADNSVLIEYVNAGGNVYVFSGGDTEPGKWNVFLQHFGLQFESVNNGISGNIPITGTHPLFSGVHYLYHDIGTSVDDLNPTDPKNEVIDVYQGQGLFAVYDPKAVPL